MSTRWHMLASLRGLLGGLAGGAIGAFVFLWMYRQGYAALMLPGAAVGLGWGWTSRHRSLVDGAVCGLLGLALGVFCEWKAAPFIADHSLPYFFTHVHLLDHVTLAFLLLGGAFAAWFGTGRERPAEPPPSEV